MHTVNILITTNLNQIALHGRRLRRKAILNSRHKKSPLNMAQGNKDKICKILGLIASDDFKVSKEMHVDGHIILWDWMNSDGTGELYRWAAFNQLIAEHNIERKHCAIKEEKQSFWRSKKCSTNLVYCLIEVQLDTRGMYFNIQ